MALPSALTQDEVQALASAHHADPFARLGMHADEQGRLWVRAVLPGARRVGVIDAARPGRVLKWLDQFDGTPVFEAMVPVRRKKFDYRLRVIGWLGDTPMDIVDVYRFGTFTSDMDLWLLGEGRHTRPYEFLGAHPRTLEGIEGSSFALWAPNARRVSVVGDFNGWDGRHHVMRLRGSSEAPFKWPTAWPEFITTSRRQLLV